MKRLLDRSYYCDLCKVGYNSIGNHKCKNTCIYCYRFNCVKTDTYKCNFCFKTCNNDMCLKLHQEHFCNKIKNCFICNRRKLKNHVCNDEKWCDNCKKSVSLDHLCYILTDSQKNKPSKASSKKFNGYIFFDYEAYQSVNGTHIPNLIMAQKVCTTCQDSAIRCNNCLKKYIFYNNDSFCRWLLKQHHYIAIAHNLKGYDGTFIVKYLIDNLLPKDPLPKLIVNGTKILSIDFKTLKIIDSYSFLPMALDKFPATFDLKELKKGFFPHGFNRLENQSYIGNYPDKNYYGSKFFSNDKALKFDIWYDSVKDNIFDFKQEFLDYCWSDVQLLTEGCLQFRKIFIENSKKNDQDTGIEPFHVAITIASLCNTLYRRNMMPENKLAIIPENGYNREQKTSNKCQLWLKYLSESKNIFIQHSKNIGELQIGKYFVDGYDSSTNTIYEFHGCLFHGCQKCYLENTWNSFKQETMKTTYSKHLERINFLKNNSNNATIIEMWECDWNKLCKNDDHLKSFLINNQIKDNLIPRDALYGGRTNAIKLYHNCEFDEMIKYYDFTSLYPYVQKYGIFPIGHPTIITENFDYDKKYFGLIYCKILAPRNLYIPVLPNRYNGKLVFSLCEKCAIEQYQEKCICSDEERAMEGTWVSLEIDEAIKRGYKIIKYYEIWHWDNTEQYDSSTKTGGIFTSYINAALKEKQEASGFPANCTTDDDKIKYIQDYFEKEGILLVSENIKKNNGKRNVAKLKANSQWGFLAMNTNKSQIKFITNKHDWYDLLTNDRYILHNVDFINDKIIQAYYSYNEDMHFGGNRQNVVLAAFVTCQARLKLYKELEKLDRRVLYFDTDSIFFISIPNHYEPSLGNYLGDFTNEIDPKEGAFIKQAVFAGPKNYGFLTNLNITHVTIKGITQCKVSDLSINYESIKNIVTNNQKEIINVEQLKFSRNKQDWSVSSNIIQKLYGFCYDKRVLQKDLTTLPYGY